MRRLVIFTLCLLGYFVFGFQSVSAYDEVCVSGEIHSDGVSYKDCGNSNIFVSDKFITHSSYLTAETPLDYRQGKIIYAGKIDGLDTFYSSGFNYFGVVYDERNIFDTKMNIWSDISINGSVVYSGKIEDTVLVDQSYRKFINYYNEVGTYLIRQFIGSTLFAAIRVIVVDKRSVDLGVEEVLYGDHLVSEYNLPYSNSGLTFKLSGGKYGFGRIANVKINDCEFKIGINGKILEIDGNMYSKCFKINEQNEVDLELFDGLGRNKVFKYIFNLLSEKVSIKLEDSVNASITASRRILIKANPGIGNTLDEAHSLYYWSHNPNHKLTYEDFMTNYSLSEYKGMYSSNKGVILRNSDGVYYLYVLAKDDDSAIVVRSNEYVLKDKERLAKFSFGDVLFVLSLTLCAVVPIFIYILVRGKDTA